MKEIDLTLRLSGTGLRHATKESLARWIRACLDCNTNHIGVLGLSISRTADIALVPVQLRRVVDSGEPVLFFRNATTDGSRQWLDCYMHVGQHSEASEEFRMSCRALDPDNLPEDAQVLLNEWNGLPGGCMGFPVRNLPRRI